MKHVRLIVSLFLIAVAILVSFASCRTQKFATSETKKENTKDSFQYREIATEHKVVVPADTVSVYVPYKLLYDTVYTYAEKSNGRAKVIIEKKGNAGITITAQCDSLEKILITKDKEIYQLQKQLVEQTKEKQATIELKRPLWETLVLWAFIIYGFMQAILFIIQFFKTPIWAKILRAARKLIKL